jgi:hypothetical protein
MAPITGYYQQSKGDKNGKRGRRIPETEELLETCSMTAEEKYKLLHDAKRALQGNKGNPEALRNLEQSLRNLRLRLAGKSQ